LKAKQVIILTPNVGKAKKKKPQKNSDDDEEEANPDDEENLLDLKQFSNTTSSKAKTKTSTW